MQACGAIDYVRERSLELTRKAKAGLEGVPLEKMPKELLFSMADFFVERLA